MKKNTLRVFISLASISLLIGVQQQVDAAIFKCVNNQGETYYNDKPCPRSDKETQLNNIKDPVGGYIPPAFKADVKAKGSKGVVVGEKTDENNNNEHSEDISDSESINDSNDGSGSSGSNNLDNNGNGNGNDDDNVAVKAKKSGSKKRTKPKGLRKKPLPTVPLKKEKVTKEPRSKIS